MNKSIIQLIGQKQRSNIFKGVYHAPLIVDAASQTVYRKQGFASWPVVAKNKAGLSSFFYSVKLAYYRFWRRMPGVKNSLGL